MLLAILVHQLEFEKITATLANVQWIWFIAATLVLALGQVFSAYRWHQISDLLGIDIPFRSALKVYVQGITMNTVLPGGIVTGDAWRTLHLTKRGDKKTALTSVLLDRFSGFWALGLLSLIATALSTILNSIGATIDHRLLWGYTLGLIAIIASPVVLSRLFKDAWKVLYRTTLVSLVVQLLSIASFALCLNAVGGNLPVIVTAAACAGIFISAIIPASVGGFGARELGAVAFLSPLGLSPELGFTASFLFGLAGTCIGAIGIVGWMNRQ